MPFAWTSKRVLVTGGTGFLGRFVVDKLRERGCTGLILARSRTWDLRDPRAVVSLFRETRPELVIHLAGIVGGIGANALEPGRFFYDNAVMGLQVMEQARRFGVEKFVTAGTVCSYPASTPLPFREEQLWSGYPEAINAPYALAKKMLLVQSRAYREQYGFNAVYLLLSNLYGPGENFDLRTSHVIPSLIRKCIEAKQAGAERVVLWGDGSPTRDFLYVDDAAEGLLLACEKYDRDEPVNIGTGRETSIQALARVVAEQTGFNGSFVWDTSRPNGQLRRCLDITRAQEWLGFEPRVVLVEGIARTVEWYLTRHAKETEPSLCWAVPEAVTAAPCAVS